jgi:hypothetical protein
MGNLFSNKSAPPPAPSAPPPPAPVAQKFVPPPSSAYVKPSTTYLKFEDFDRIVIDPDELWYNHIKPYFTKDKLKPGDCIVSVQQIDNFIIITFIIYRSKNDPPIRFKLINSNIYTEYNGLWGPRLSNEKRPELFNLKPDDPSYRYDMYNDHLKGTFNIKSDIKNFDECPNLILEFINKNSEELKFEEPIRTLTPLRYSHINKIQGGNIFQGTFQMTPLKFIWAVIVVIVISIMITLVGGLVLYGINFLKLPNVATALVTLAIGILMIYAPYDYIYTMGYDDRK